MSDCLFCKIVAGEIPAEVVAEDDRVLAFKDINPGAPVHLLVIPKRHVANSSTVEEADEALVGHVVRVGCQVASEAGLSESGFRLVLNNGRDAGEAVNHLHLHVIGGRALDWPPG
ncbi:MAG TPA: histidine triad nucleotide-binding protein [Armatimonadota bacterium]|nr:histidine triad nucleotide-binding protein [Armatimonadota bacterium]